MRIKKSESRMKRTRQVEQSPRTLPTHETNVVDGCSNNVDNSVAKHCTIQGVNITAFGRKLTLFSAIPLSRFSLKMSRFFAYFKLEKNALYARCSASCGTQTTRQPANSLCKIFKLRCFSCLRLSPSRVIFFLSMLRA